MLPVSLLVLVAQKKAAALLVWNKEVASEFLPRPNKIGLTQ